MMFTGENDGKVSVERAKLPGMRDFRVLDVAHPFIMQNPEVMRLSLGFLREGKFPN
jgi:triacylglycerol lipase